MDPVYAVLQAGTSSLSFGFVDYLTTISAIGVITMALIQTAKDMLPIRRWYQRRRFRAWLADGVREAAVPDRSAVLFGQPAGRQQPDAAAAEARLVSLATDGDAHALYDLPIEQMCGQINAALQVVLEYPADDPNLVAIVGSRANAADLAMLIGVANGAMNSATARTPEVSAAKARVMHQFQRAIDAFQIAVSYRWKMSLQIASLVLCGLLTYAALLLRFHVGTSYVGGVGAVVIGAVLAGFLAPVARDLTAAVQGLRK